MGWRDVPSIGVGGGGSSTGIVLWGPGSPVLCSTGVPPASTAAAAAAAAAVVVRVLRLQLLTF